jgi:hypothetical protein
MLVYHGSHLEVPTPDSRVGRKKLDFGRGFYATTLAKQAEQWAVRKAYENETSVAIVSVYEYDETGNLATLRFEDYDRDWLDFVVENRRSTSSASQNQYDVIVGGIADDRVIDTINYYIEEIEAGRHSKELVELTLILSRAE